MVHTGSVKHDALRLKWRALISVGMVYALTSGVSFAAEITDQDTASHQTAARTAEPVQILKDDTPQVPVAPEASSLPAGEVSAVQPVTGEVPVTAQEAEPSDNIPESVDQMIDRHILQSSVQLPLVLDELTRLDRLSRPASMTIQYDFSILGTRRADLDEDAVRQILQGVANVGCKGHEQFLSAGIRVDYRYAVDGEPIGAVLLDTVTCSRQPLSVSDPSIQVINPGAAPATLSERLQRYVKRDSAGLPLMVDRMIRLERVDQSDNTTLNYHLTLLNTVRKEISARLIQVSLLSLSEGACSAFEPLFRQGGSVRYLLNLEDGPAGQLEVNQALCDRQPIRASDPALVVMDVPGVPINLDEMMNRHVEEASTGLPQMMSNILRLDRVHRIDSTMIGHEVTVMHDDEHPVSRQALRTLMLDMIAPGCRAYEWFIAAGVRIKVDFTLDGSRHGTLLLDQAVCERVPVKEDDPAAIVFNETPVVPHKQ